jgi:hypothetical protein
MIPHPSEIDSQQAIKELNLDPCGELSSWEDQRFYIHIPKTDLPTELMANLIWVWLHSLTLTQQYICTEGTKISKQRKMYSMPHGLMKN